MLSILFTSATNIMKITKFKRTQSALMMKEKKKHETERYNKNHSRRLNNLTKLQTHIIRRNGGSTQLSPNYSPSKVKKKKVEKDEKKGN